MTVSTNETIVALRGQMPEVAERALREWMQAVYADMLKLKQKLDDDTGVTDENYESTITGLGA